MTTHVELPATSDALFCFSYGFDPSKAACSWTLNVEDTVCETCTESKSNDDVSVTQVSCLLVPPPAAGVGRQFYYSIVQQKRSVGHPAAAPGRAERED